MSYMWALCVTSGNVGLTEWSCVSCERYPDDPESNAVGDPGADLGVTTWVWPHPLDHGMFKRIQ